MKNAYELLNDYEKAVELKEKCWDGEVGKLEEREVSRTFCACRMLIDNYTELIKEVMKTMGGEKNEKS